MKFSIFQTSRQGGRKYNQDRIAYSYSKESLLMVVADGMGGHFHGELAAQVTVQLFTEMFQKQAKPILKDPQRFLNDAMFGAHEAIGAYAQQHDLLETPRTTCVACVVQQNHVIWSHVGDSRLYFFRGTDLVTRTLDHSKVQQLFEDGKITEAQMTTHPERNKIYNCLGGIMAPEVELSKRMPIRDGDTLLLCSDGLWSMLSVNEIASILDAYPITKAIPELLDHAEFRGGEEGDNLSAIGMTWGEQLSDADNLPISTITMPLNTFTTQMDEFDVARAVQGEPMITDEDIERAISEIQTTIQKYSK